jgi:DNA repair protein RecO (recombination protein O)
MQRIEAQPAFILHERPYRETSVLLEVLTRDHGRVGLIAHGVRAAKPRFGRGLLRPLQALSLSWQARGELGTLTDADPVGTPIPLADEALLCALYVNELLTRLLSRHDAHVELISRYAQCLGELALADLAAQAWALRRFERDLLGILGYGLNLELDQSGATLDPRGAYRFDPELGAQPVGGHAPYAISGAALIALGGDTPPPPAQAKELRRLMRAVLRHHLGGHDLAAWRLVLPSSGGRPAASPVSEVGDALDD